MRSFFFNHIILPVSDIIFCTKLNTHLKYLERSQWFTPDQIQGIQNEKLKALIKHVYETVPFYHDLMTKNNLVPSDIQTTDDLIKIPAVTKDQLKENTPHRTISNRFQLKGLMPRYTSGSTGEPLKFFITKNEKAMKRAAFTRFWRWAGWDFGAKYLNITSAPISAFQNGVLHTLESFLMKKKFISANHLGAVHLHEVIRFNPQFIHGYASSIYCLAQDAKTHGIQLNPKSVLTTSETLLPKYRSTIEGVFGAKVYDEYGGEDMTFMAQCEEADLYHLNAENVFIELVKNGKRVKPGEIGEVLITNLNRYAMPFIRYKIVDLARQSKRSCPCGRGLPTYDRIEGRISDIIVTPSGQKLTVGVFAVIFEYIQEIKMFQIIQRERDLLLIRVVTDAGFGQETEKIILKKIADYVGSKMHLSLELVDEIETTPAGKRRICISEIKNESV